MWRALPPAIAVIAALTAAGCGLTDPYGSQQTPATRPVATRPASLPTVEGVRIARADAVGADAVAPALRFARAYLSYQYGRLGARDLPAIDPALRATLAAIPPRVPAAIRARHVRIEMLRLSRTSPGAVDAIAVVRDGVGTTALSFMLVHARDGWTTVAADGVAAPGGDS